jgi:hypothetical protein
MSINSFWKESSIFRFTLIFHHVLTNLEFALKFMRCFIVGECALFSNEVKNHFVDDIVADTTANQLGIPYYASYVWPALKKKVPLVFNFAVHIFFLECSPNPLSVKDINHGFEKEVKESLKNFPCFVTLFSLNASNMI